MVMHARSGGNLEVMGLMLGKVDGPTMVVMDSFALPVEGTETRVNAQAQAYEYMAAYTESAKQVDHFLKSFKWKEIYVFSPPGSWNPLGAFYSTQVEEFPFSDVVH